MELVHSSEHGQSAEFRWMDFVEKTISNTYETYRDGHFAL